MTARRAPRPTLALLAVLILAVGVLLAAPAARARGAAGRAVLPDHGAFLGAMTNPNRATNDSTPGEVAGLEQATGRRLAVVNRFYAYPELVTGEWERADLAAGRTPMITWGASDTRALADGSQDAYLSAQARSIASLKGQVLLRFFHEPEGDYRTSITHSPADYVAAWRHVHAVFDAAGATNVEWVWCTTAWSWGTAADPAAWYPGDDVVDWVAADGYNWYPVKGGWRSFASIFSPFYAWARSSGRSILFAEVGTMEDPAVAGRKAAWLRAALTALKSDFPLVKGVLYFDTTMTHYGRQTVWDLRSSSSSIAAWAQIAADPYLSAMPAAQPVGPAPPGPVAYLQNGGFELGTVGWGGRIGGTSAAAALDTGTRRSGRVAEHVSNVGRAAATVGVGEQPQSVTATVAGRVYHVDAWATAATPGTAIKLTVTEQQNGTVRTTSIYRSVTAAGTWRELSMDVTAARNDSVLTVTVSSWTQPGAGFWLDDVTLTAP